MGTNSKASHQNYTVAPAGGEGDDDQPDSDGEGTSQEYVEAAASFDLATALAQLIAADGVDVEADLNQPLLDVPEDPVEKFDQFAEQITAARAALEAMKAAGASEEEIAEKLKEIKATSLAYLTALPAGELQQIASAKGFGHPVLVGLSGKGQHPLVHWLDPAYDPDIKSKAAIEAAAHKRYQQLLAGDTYGGLTLADVHQLEGTPMPHTGGGWQATPEQVQQAQAALAASLDGLPAVHVNGEQLATLLKAERLLAAAECPEMGDELQTAKAQAHQAVDAYLDQASVNTGNAQLAAKDAIDAGLITEQEVHLLSPRQLLRMIRPNTSAGTLNLAKGVIAKRQVQLDDLDSAMSDHSLLLISKDVAGALTLAPLGKGAWEQQGEAVKTAAEWAVSTGKLYEAQMAVTPWASNVLLPPKELVAQHPGLDKDNLVNPYAETEAFSAWAKQQKLTDLREVAEELGMTAAGKASRAHVQKFIAGHFNPLWHPPAINLLAEEAAAKKAAKAAAPPPSPTGPSSTPSAAGTSTAGAGPTPVTPITPGSKPVAPKLGPSAASGGAFAAKNKALVAALQMATAAASDLPKRMEASQVAAISFGPAQAAALGGAHSKTLHQGPDGGMWLFKPDKQAGGARAAAEAAASHALDLGGVPSVPVYQKTIGGQPGCIQPMVKGAKTLGGSPSSWTQGQVDAIVRYHVGAWLVGDHDGHAQNMIETPSGGLVNIDRGQSFKFFGRDKLDLGYAPNSGYGSVPVQQQLYSAFMGGGLGPGVKVNPAVAHPVIKSFEAIPDAQWRAVLHDTAHQGAKVDLHWVPKMRTRAAKQHGVPADQVTHTQIAEAFLDHACERKTTLRTDFADFFTKQLKLSSAAALKYGS
ncbi:hypothetical protein [Streptomyces sp. TLI_171]|uniref:hypothetical protein n=1 Tax=Streptomyces sp. TLI_171 TaxID=1938859 RepID=UPI000C1A1CCC|nr:hypothetical protein [Streptomyces sp. TLI_171]RKE03014.1 hypothetical protein BX266_7621 [Streptomyces sp. TLI_171]